ncbi:nitrogen regulatory IIA protein [Flavobacterium adhaerens]|uniref:nitrogen regulatory IIA protein n=1 Tax=Flavobacterium adhaerens TaxID=3149043 RepID=UPI0032B498E0
MKKIRANINRYFERLDDRWRILPIRKQYQYTLYFFTVYLLLTIAVILKVGYDTSKPDNNMVIEHIRNPVFEKK